MNFLTKNYSGGFNWIPISDETDTYVGWQFKYFGGVDWDRFITVSCNSAHTISGTLWKSPFIEILCYETHQAQFILFCVTLVNTWLFLQSLIQFVQCQVLLKHQPYSNTTLQAFVHCRLSDSFLWNWKTYHFSESHRSWTFYICLHLLHPTG